MYKTISPVISQKQSQQAQLLASKLNDSKSRKQANIDFLGCLYLIDYFQSIGIRVNSQRSIFRCSKLYKDFEAVDIYCNSHMLYVVTSYGTDYVKIPAMHRQFEMLPEAYVVVDLKIGMREAEIKGFITPADFDYAQTDGKYYKFDINKLTPFDNLLEPLRKYTGIKSSVGKHLDCMKLFVPYIDNKLSDEDKKKLINHILTCETCKKRLIDSIEFDNNAGNLDKYPSVVSKNDLTSKAAFKARLMKSAAKENEQVKGAIDVIYKNEALSALKDEAFKYKTDFPVKTKKLIMIASVFGLLLLVLLVFAFNIPKRHQTDKNNAKTVQGEVVNNNGEQKDIETVSDYEIKIPKLKANIPLMNVSKVSWEVQSEIKNDSQKKFLQSAGKSIRLNLQNDLLLSGSAAVNNKVKFNIRFLRDGSIETIEIAESSGTGAVDKIIQKSIEDTLSFMRPPKGSFVGKRNALTLVIEF
ncbi:TPA: DUF1822 family protein [Candidatus Galligastranaerophilus gallistercoris]|nr:DUF1822 family protein [Candidatus Galligastranaerophilus gallistercoris]